MAHLNFTEPQGPFFTYDPSTFEHICNEPMLPDPYETQTVTVRCSKVRGAGEGKFDIALMHQIESKTFLQKQGP